MASRTHASSPTEDPPSRPEHVDQPSSTSAAPPAAATPPASAQTFLAEARAARDDPDRLAAICERALANAPDDLRSLVDLGSVARDAGRSDVAENVFTHILARDPGYLFAHYEMAVTRMLANEHRSAVASLDRLVGLNPNEVRGRLLAARLRCLLGEHDEAAEDLDAIPPGASDEMVAVLRAFGTFTARHPQAAAIGRCEAFETSPRYRDARGVFAALMGAARDRRPFSLVRGGDGEGAFLRLSDEDEAAHAALYAYNRTDRGRVWFADTLDLDRSGFTAAAAGVGAALRGADIVGLPYPFRLRNEYRLASIASISALANLLRFAEDIPGEFCSQDVHTLLQKQGLLAELLATQSRVGLISCHRELPAMLRHAFDFAEVRYHYIPGEKAHGHLVGPRAVEGDHWPDHYGRVMEALRQPLDGLVYLIAGGILGKLYCQRVRELGGIAIDIGSVADGWVGARTRPGLQHLSLRP